MNHEDPAERAYGRRIMNEYHRFIAGWDALLSEELERVS